MVLTNPLILETRVLTRAGLLHLHCRVYSSRVGPPRLSPPFLSSVPSDLFQIFPQAGPKPTSNVGATMSPFCHL